jgi:hypothetical protein
MPLFNEAIAALKTLKVNDFVTMKSFQKPPTLIRLALEGVCIMLGIKPKFEEQGSGKDKKKVEIYWEQSKKLLADYKKFLSMLEKYEKDSIPEERIHKI